MQGGRVSQLHRDQQWVGHSMVTMEQEYPKVALCNEGKQASKPSLARPVTAFAAAEDSSSVGGSPGKQLDRRGIVIWGGSRLFAPATSHSLRRSATRTDGRAPS